MKAIVFKDVGDIRLEEVKDPVIENPKDVIVRITTSAICGTDLHLIRGTMPGMKSETVLGHEGIGIIEQVGAEVKDFKLGDRVIIPSTISCGYCDYCKEEIYSQCDNANPNGPDAGTAFYGGPKTTGPFNGLQAEKARVPFADASLIKIPENITDEQAILLSDILPTASMAVAMASIKPADTVAVFGCGPVGQLVIACLKRLAVKAIFAIDCVPSRLDGAKKQGAHTINFNHMDPVKELKKLTHKRGPTKIIDAVGVDAEQPHCCGLLFFKGLLGRRQFAKETRTVAPRIHPSDGNWQPGGAPSQVVDWAVRALAKAGTLSIIGVYPEQMRFFPIGQAMGKNLTIRMGNCNHRAYIPLLLEWVKEGSIDLEQFITQIVPFADSIDAYKQFDKREQGWIKVVLSMSK